MLIKRRDEMNGTREKKTRRSPRHVRHWIGWQTNGRMSERAREPIWLRTHTHTHRFSSIFSSFLYFLHSLCRCWCQMTRNVYFFRSCPYLANISMRLFFTFALTGSPSSSSWIIFDRYLGERPSWFRFLHVKHVMKHSINMAFQLIKQWIYLLKILFFRYSGAFLFRFVACVFLIFYCFYLSFSFFIFFSCSVWFATLP